MRLLPLELAVLLAACDAAAPIGEADERAPTTIRAAQGFIVPPGRLVLADDLAGAVHDAGYPCETVTAFGQVELNGEALDNYKIDCGNRSYLLTWLEAGSRIKPWTGEAIP
jgi:hypothetical protein